MWTQDILGTGQRCLVTDEVMGCKEGEESVNRSTCTWIVAGLLLLKVSITNAAAPQMVTPGGFAVSPHGEATYSIGIQVPPGIAGIEPQLTLIYSSDSGNGRLGVDWNLGGTSEIYRCPQTNAQDGGVRAVSLDANDRFCIDGARLVVVSGAYGAEGSEYRTEIDGFTKIISHTTVGNGPGVSNGPAWFEVWTKAGQYKTYGNSVDSRVVAVGVSPATARVWALNRVQDAVSNYMTYTYTQDTVNGDYYPSQINYTGNTAQSQAPTNQISFVWAARTDAVTVYQAGAKIAGLVRLTDIKTYVGSGSTLVRDYQLAYGTSATTGRSEMTSVTECPASGACLPATSFTWTNHVKGMTDMGTAIPAKYANFQSTGRIFMADVNGDGIADVVLGPDTSGNWYVMLGTGTGFVDQGAWITGVDVEAVNGADGIRVMDVNGDGLADIEMGPDGNGKFFVLISTGHSFIDGGAWASGVYANWTGSRSRIYVMDVNGDGLEDLMLGPDTNGNWYVLQSTGTSFVDKGAWATGKYANWAASVNRTFIADVNGDGLQDVVLGPDSSGNWFVLRSTGTNFVDDGAWITGAHADWAAATSGIHAMDVNGDGLTDIEMGPDASGNWYVMLSTGKKFVDGLWATGKYANWAGSRNRLYVADTNGDGLQDIILGPDTTGHWYVMRSTGTSLVDDGVVSCCAYTSSFVNANLVYGVEMNGDGLKDLLIGPDGNGNWYHIDSNPANERVTAINDGLATTSLTFAPLTSSSVYTRDSGVNAAIYPIMDLQFPAYVVSSVNTPNGIGGTLTTNYTYGGFKTDLTGRGILGPRWVNATRPAIGQFAARTTYTLYNQLYPFNGFVTKSQDIVAGGGNGGVLTEVDNSYQCYSGSASPVPTSSSCTLAPGLRYFPYTSQSVVTRWDLNGTPVPTVTTNFSYDTWGNVTNVVSSTSDGFTKVTGSTYLPANTSSWILGRLSTAQVTSTSPQTVPGYLLSTPPNLTATAVAAKQVNLTWSAASDVGGVGLAGYHVYRGGTLIGSSASTSYSDTTTVAFTAYTYTVAAYDNTGNVSLQSNSASVTTPAYPLPSAPTGLSATATGQTTVQLAWTQGPDAGGPGISGYKVYRAGTQIGTSATTGFTDSTAVASTAYTYTIAEYDTSGNTSAQSSSASATTPAIPPPTVPTGLAKVSATSTQVALSWSASTDTGGPGLAGYRIYRGGTQIGTSTAAGYTDNTTAGTTTYSYTVAAYDNAGNVSAQSSALNVTTPDTIAPSVPTGVSATAISAAQVNLTWSASTDTGGSGLAGYKVYRAGTQIGTSTTTSYSDTTVSGSTTYTYTVVAYDNAGNTSTVSAGASVTTPLAIPSVPGTPSPTRKVTTLSWTESWGASTGPIHHYILQRTINFNPPENFTITAPTISMAQAGGNGDSFSFQVQGCNSSNQCSAWSGQTGVTICDGGICP
jgi:chitodextrinase